MKIIVKHLATEIEISDNQATDDGRGLLYHNWTSTKEILSQMVEKVKELSKIGNSEKAGEIGEINHLDTKHIVSRLDEARELNQINEITKLLL